MTRASADKCWHASLGWRVGFCESELRERARERGALGVRATVSSAVRVRSWRGRAEVAGATPVSIANRDELPSQASSRFIALPLPRNVPADFRWTDGRLRWHFADAWRPPWRARVFAPSAPRASLLAS